MPLSEFGSPGERCYRIEPLCSWQASTIAEVEAMPVAEEIPEAPAPDVPAKPFVEQLDEETG